MKRLLFINVLILCVFVCITTASALPWTYTYTGNPYDQFSPDYDIPSGTYTTDDRLIVSMTLLDPLPSNETTNPIYVNPTYFSVSDGRFTFASKHPGGVWGPLTISVGSTDDYGLPATWGMFIVLPSPDYGQVGSQVHRWWSGKDNPILSIDNGDTAYVSEFIDGKNSSGDHLYIGEIANARNPGTWSAAPVPEPATMLLFSAGIIVLAGFGKKRLKK